jgi:hypothetical protein
MFANGVNNAIFLRLSELHLGLFWQILSSIGTSSMLPYLNLAGNQVGVPTS